MFQWSDEEQPIHVALEAQEHISCNVHWGTLDPQEVNLPGSFGALAKKGSNQTPASLRMRKSGVLGILQHLLNFRQAR